NGVTLTDRIARGVGRVGTGQIINNLPDAGLTFAGDRAEKSRRDLALTVLAEIKKKLGAANADAAGKNGGKEKKAKKHDHVAVFCRCRAVFPWKNLAHGTNSIPVSVSLNLRERILLFGPSS